MSDTITTPFGAVPKKTAMIVGGGAVLIFGIVWYRSKKNASASAAAGANTGVNPATGYPYGSAEDAAALAAQAAYITPTGGGGGGGSGAFPSGGVGGAYVSNQQWSQAVIEYMTAHGLVSDASALSEALGKYLTGQPVITAPMRSLIEQAIALSGFPPIAGTGGYPPSINTSNPVPGSTTPPPTQTPPPTPAASTGPVWQNVFPGQVVDDWINAATRQYGTHWGQLVALPGNETLATNVSKSTNPRLRVFLFPTAYRAR